MKETQIQQAILHYLQLLENQGKVYAFRNNSFQGHITRRYYTKSRGVVHTQGYIKNAKRGMPDIIVCANGRFVGLEVKREGNYQTEVQKLAQEQIEGSGGLYFVVRSVDDAKKALKSVL
jgi:hypothetical protein